MVLNNNYENRFLKDELMLGIGFQGKELQSFDYKRIFLLGTNFKKVINHYENVQRIEFEEFKCRGVFDEVYCFCEDIKIGYESVRKYSIQPMTTIVFTPLNLKIWFYE